MGRLLGRAFAPVEVTETVPAAPADVFAVLADPDTYPRWLVGADRMRGVDPEFPEPGSEFHHSVGPGGPLTIDDRSESVAMEPDHHLALRVHAGPFHARVDFTLAAVAGGTEVRMAERPIGPLSMLAPLLRPTLYARNRKSLAALADLVAEGGTCVTETVDAVVVGAGHNGLVAANLLADAGWDVLVLEHADIPGGAVRDAEVTAPGFRTDLFSAFYPMTAASPVMQGLGLEDFGLTWTHAAAPLAHVRPDAPAVVLHRDAARTAAALDAAHPGDGAAWHELQARWDRLGPALMRALLSPMPPVVGGAQLAWRARSELLELARMMVMPVRRFAQERFGGDGPGLLLAGNALHADVAPESAPSALLGWMLVGLGQSVGFPVPIGGSGRIIDALVARLRAAGGDLRCSCPVERVELAGLEATGVVTAGGTVRARRAVLAACDAQILYDHLVGADRLPAAFAAGLRRFQRADATVKVNWALDAPVPWRDGAAAGAGTVHIADSIDELTTTAAELATGRLPARPFLLVGQMTTSDPTRSPPGTESLWAYTHVPQDPRSDAGGAIAARGRLQGAALGAFVERMQARIEAHAPGFGDHVLARHVQGPGDLEAADPSLVGGDVSGGTSQLHQQLVFRPVPGFGRAETPFRRLFLASASAHPGGSVHGACGANAARAALWHHRRTRLFGGVARRAA